MRHDRSGSTLPAPQTAIDELEAGSSPSDISTPPLTGEVVTVSPVAPRWAAPAHTSQPAARNGVGASHLGNTVPSRRAPERRRRHDSGVASLVKSSPRGLQLNARMPYEIWRALGARIAARSDATSWWLGDWVVFGEQQYGQRYRHAIQATGLDYQTLRNYAVVARRFKPSRRRDNLSFQHHAEVCALSDHEQDEWMDLAAQNHWSKSELRSRIRSARRLSRGLDEQRALRLSIDLQREQRWREAAARCDCAFEDWVIQSLDAAARTAIVDL
jgi:hypothetical protein